MPVKAIVDNLDYGVTVAEIAEQFEIEADHPRFPAGHEVRTFVEMQWHPQLENGELLKSAEDAGFDVMVTSDQNIRGISKTWLVGTSLLWCSGLTSGPSSKNTDLR